MRIREAETRDAKRLRELNQQFNGVSGVFGIGSAGGERVLVAEVADEIVGFACMQIMRSVCYSTPWAELTELYVEEHGRRCGVGRALVAEAERVAWDAGCSEMLLRTHATNREARALFADRGFGEANHICLRKRRPSTAT